MDKANHFTLDLSAQIDCDTAGIQLLLSTRKTAEQTNKSFTIAYPNAAVRKAAERLGIALGNEFQLIEEANR
jgi:anti-anti-sigma regulatory factor